MILYITDIGLLYYYINGDATVSPIIINGFGSLLYYANPFNELEIL